MMIRLRHRFRSEEAAPVPAPALRTVLPDLTAPEYTGPSRAHMNIIAIIADHAPQRVKEIQQEVIALASKIALLDTERKTLERVIAAVEADGG
jgi:hypothetical protein